MKQYISAIFIIASLINGQQFSKQPKILLQDGHLIIQASAHNNISFITQGLGRVHVNGVDITKVSEISNNVIQAMSKYTITFETAFEKISKFDEILDNGGIKGTTNRGNDTLTPNTYSVNMDSLAQSVRQVNNHVNNLQRKYNALTTLLNVNECANNPCQNGGTCVDLFGSFICHCPPEWEGSICSKDVNECARFAGTDLGCQNGATCVNRPGSYECRCVHGWFGLHCTRRSTDCNSGSNAELCGHGTCVNQNNEVGYKCICDQGWTTDGKSPACNVDVNECGQKKPPCSVNPPVPCLNLPGTFRCGYCPVGYSGNGYYCTDIDECAIDNGGCSQNPMVQCINTLGSRICGNCPPGYVGNGVSCSYQQGGVCSVNNGGCHPIAICRDNPRISSTYVECTCPAGYVGSGIGRRGCITNVAPVSSVCMPNPCVHGTCVNTTGTYYCQCPYRYTGRNCDKFKDMCAGNPCKNGATCVSVLGINFRCLCPRGFTGLRCNEEQQSCGGHLRVESGTLLYPLTISETFWHSISCAWTIETNTTKVLNITFTRLNLKKSENCQLDYLQIHDGTNSLAKSLGRFCGSELPHNGTIISTHNIVYLLLRIKSLAPDSRFELIWNSIEPSCGEGLKRVTSHGIIESPGSPGNYPDNRDCYWYLMAPVGKRLVFHFFTLMLGVNQDCDKDYLEFKPQIDEHAQNFAQFCNTSHPAPVFSPGPEVQIHFHSDNKDNYPGFQISYAVVEGVSGCGGVYTSDHGEIRSPFLEGSRASDLLCEYKIQLPKKSRILLKFLSLSIEDSDACKFDSVSILAGSTSSAPLIGRYCGKNLPAPYASDSNEIMVIFKIDGNTNGKGFVLKYELLCGGSFTTPNGIIESPFYPNPYPKSKSCVYKIIQPLHTTIQLQFIDLNVYSNSYPSCLYDFVQVRDGDNENSTLIGRYCQKVPTKIFSSLNYLWLEFHSDNQESNGYRGFRANFTTLQNGCGGILKEKTNTISSPPYALIYAKISNCTWIISAPSGNIIEITWINFHLEDNDQCTYNYVEVFNNDTETNVGQPLGKFCGTKIPPILLSSTNVVTVRFATDQSTNTNKFLLSYNMFEEHSVCGGNYFTNAGVIRSPYSENYLTNFMCTWVLNVEAGHQIMLNVTEFSLFLSEKCKYDFLEIRNGGTASSPLLGKFCGTEIPKLIPSHSNKLFIKSRITQKAKGFLIKWDATSTRCGGTLTAPSGSIISPNYPEPYNSNAECIWTISISAGSLIQVVFIDLDLQENVNCNLDYIELFDGSDLNSKSLGRFCMTAPAFVKSSKNHMTLKFRSDISQEGRGFQLQYNTICNNTLTGFKGVIESPNFPNEYESQLNCNWEIQVASHNKINISFSHFELGLPMVYNLTEKNCKYDYLEILYKYSKKYEDIPFNKFGTYCGKKKPPLITLDGDTAKIRFITDPRFLYNGFRLEWQINGCGGLLKEYEGTITSPNYPQGYPKSITCNWIIETDLGKSIEIVFHDLELESHNSCSFDSVKIYNGEDVSYPEIANLCYQSKPTTVVSSGNVMFISFKADFVLNGKGFKANYTTKDTKCGGRFTASKGSIMSPNYPNNYDINDTCGYLIELDEGYRIDIVVVDLDLPSPMGVECANNNQSYIKIFDGPSASYPVLTKLCGKNAPNHTFTSTYNKIFVEMVTNSNRTSKGFLAKYQKTCGARIETSSFGSIQHIFSDLDDTYSSNSMCSWTIISTEPSKHVSLTFSYLQTTGYCEDGDKTLKIYNGETQDAPLLSSYCGNNNPPTLTSDGSAVHILVEHSCNFFLTYSIYDSTCGGTLQSSNGFLASPGYPKLYPANVECEWILEIPKGNTVNFQFSAFGLQESDHCNTDFIEFRQNNSSGKYLGAFCGTDVPANIKNLGPLYIFLKTSKVDGEIDQSLKGFSAEYSLSTVSELYGPSGIIESPRLLGPEIQEYTYRITVDFGERILITLKDFNLNILRSRDVCTPSSLSIYDGYNKNGPLLGKFCGSKIPDPIKSTTQAVTIVLLILEDIRVSNYFRLEWLRISQDLNNLVPLQPKVKKCGSSEPIDIHGLKNATILSSPGYPNGYQNDLHCEWIFTTVQMNHIVISFKNINFDIYPTNPEYMVTGCDTDYVEILEKDAIGDWKSRCKVCRTNDTLHIIDSTNLVKLVFVSDGYNNGSGFSATVQEDCGGLLTDPEGVIVFNSETKLMYPAGHRTHCQWNVTVKAGTTIEVEIIELNIKNEKLKCKNYLILRNGLFPDSPILGNNKLCDSTLPKVMQTTGNNLNVKYVGNLQLGNFEIRYRQISYDCGGEILLNQFEKSTEISTPNYPNIPPPHIECIWIIMAPPADLLRIDFLDRFDLATSDECTKEFVEIRDGGTSLSPLIGRYCTTVPGSQFTTDNIMFVRYFTGVNEPNNGFKAQITFDICGGTIRGKAGRIASPYVVNPYKYPENVNCTWHLIGPQGHTLTIEFISIDLGYSNDNCSESGNYIKIYETEQALNKSTVLGYFCNKKLPTPIYTSSNEAFVNFHISQKRQTLGFSLKFNSTLDSCVGTLQASQGYIKSPNYPYQRGRMACHWLIQVPRGRRVMLEILDIDFKASHLRPHLYTLVIFNGPELKARLASLTKSGEIHKVIESTDNTMGILYWAYGVEGRGFKAKFTSFLPKKCRGFFNDDSSILMQPNELDKTYYCKYVRDKAVDGYEKTLAMSLNVVIVNKIVDNSFCERTPHVITFRSQDENDAYFKYCSSADHLIVRSPFPINTITAILSNRQVTMNYTISYTSYPCGGIVKTGQIGTIHSPDYPNKPSKSYECVWLIEILDAQSIQITFNDFKLGGSCDFSYVDIYNGKSPLSPKINRFCQGNKPEPFKSQTNHLWIEYKFDQDSSSGKGFSLMYEPIFKGCGGIIYSSDIIIQTPNFPTEYPNNAECLWELHSDEGFHIGLIFNSRFYLEDSSNCLKDFVEIWDWKEDGWVSLGRRCGRETPQIYNSTSNKMKILFRSNENITGYGFKAKWEWNCGGSFIADSKEKFITSPGFPISYSPNLFCQYNITVKEVGEQINIHFTDFDLDQSNCFDNVTITMGSYSTQVFCGNDLPVDVRFPNSVIITFLSDQYLEGSGFKFTYQTDNCGGHITKPQMIKTPEFKPAKRSINYNGYISCIWNITAPAKKSILLQFQKFNLQRRYSCTFDNVDIFNGTTVDFEKKIVNLCGDLSDSLPEIRSESSNVIIQFNTEKTVEHEGFEALVSFVHGTEEGCGGILNIANATELIPPNLGPMDCSWSIFGTYENTLKIKFTKINLLKTCALNNNLEGNGTSLKDCDCGFIEIKDGGSTLSESIEKICGVQSTNFQREITTSGSSATIRFSTGFPVNGDAFKATITPIPSICGPFILNVTKETQNLTSPNYPNTYPPNLRCSWTIISATSRFVLHFEEIDLIEENNDHYKLNACKKDKIQLIDNIGITGGIQTYIEKQGKTRLPSFSAYGTSGLYEFCGKMKSFDYFPNTLSLTLNFVTSSSVLSRGKGFKLQYQEMGCNYNYTSNQGRLKGVIDKDCITLISVSRNATISLYFYEFSNSVVNKEDSDVMGMEIRDGGDKNAKLLLKPYGYGNPNPIFSSGNQLWIHTWKTYSVNYHFGSYDLFYTASDRPNGCGGSFYNYLGKFTSPLYPLSYTLDEDPCVWEVQVPLGRRVALKFPIFDIQGSCKTNYVTVTTYEGDDPTEHKFCKDDEPAVLYSSSYYLSVAYKANSENNGTGWMALFEAVDL